MKKTNLFIVIGMLATLASCAHKNGKNQETITVTKGYDLNTPCGYKGCTKKLREHKIVFIEAGTVAPEGGIFSFYLGETHR